MRALVAHLVRRGELPQDAQLGARGSNPETWRALLGVASLLQLELAL